jgi:hypothetical protein
MRIIDPFYRLRAFGIASRALFTESIPTPRRHATSVLRTRDPNETGSNPAFLNRPISLSDHPPSGPIASQTGPRRGRVAFSVNPSAPGWAMKRAAARPNSAASGRNRSRGSRRNLPERGMWQPDDPGVLETR